jgi:flagellar biosynthesis/type III secretory pathway chaperone
MESAEDIKEKRAQLINKLSELSELYNQHNKQIMLGNIDYNDSIKEDFLHANLVEILKQNSHPIIKDLDEVGLVDYYNSVIQFVKLRTK